MPQLQNRLLNYGLAVAAVAIATGATWLARPYLEPVNMALFFAAVAFSAWRGGIGAGLTATALSVLAISHIFIEPIYSLKTRSQGVIPLGIFALVAIFISSLSAQLKLAKRETEVSFRAQIEAEKGRSQLVGVHLAIGGVQKIVQPDPKHNEKRELFSAPLEI